MSAYLFIFIRSFCASVFVPIDLKFGHNARIVPKEIIYSQNSLLLINCSTRTKQVKIKIKNRDSDPTLFQSRNPGIEAVPNPGITGLKFCVFIELFCTYFLYKQSNFARKERRRCGLTTSQLKTVSWTSKFVVDDEQKVGIPRDAIRWRATTFKVLPAIHCDLHNRL